MRQALQHKHALKTSIQDFTKTELLLRNSWVFSMNWGVLVVGVPTLRATLFVVYVGAADFWKLPH